MNTLKTLVFRGSPASPHIVWNNFFTKGKTYTTHIEGDDYYIVYCDVGRTKKVPKMLFYEVSDEVSDEVTRGIMFALVFLFVMIGVAGSFAAFTVNWKYIGIPVICVLIIREFNKAIKQ